MRMRFIFLLILLFPLFSPAQNNDSVEYSSINDTISLKEISVSANQGRQISGMLSGDISLSVDKLSSIPALAGTVDVLKLLELTPSIKTSGDANTNIYVRGGDAGQNLILYDGVATYTPGHALGIFPMFNADHLSSLKLSKGSANAEYGNYLSSVIEVTTHNQVPTKFGIKGNVGILATQISSTLPINQNWGAYASLRKTYLNQTLKPFLKKALQKETEDMGLGYDFWDANLSVVGKLGRNNTLSLNVLSGQDILNIEDDELGMKGDIRWKNNIASAKLTSYISEGLKLEQQVSYSGFKNTLDTDQEKFLIKLKSNIEDISYKNKASFWIKELPVNIGVQYTHYNLTPYDLYIENSGVSLNSVKEDEIGADYLSAFISTSFKLIDQLTLKPGLRYNYFSSKLSSQKASKQFNSIDARLYAQYKISDVLYLRGNFSHNNQYINKLTPSSVGLPSDFWITASSQIKPQSGDELSIGGYHVFKDGMFEISGDIFYRQMHDITQFDYNFIENENTSFVDKILYGDGRAYGLELMLKKNYGQLTGWISYALGKSERKFDDINGGNYFPAKFDRHHDLSATFNYKVNSRWDLSLTQIYATGNTYTQPTSWYFINGLPVKEYTKYNNARLPDYNRTDIGINYWFRKDNGLNFSIYNMFFVQNPLYVFLDIKQKDDNLNGEEARLRIKHKAIFRIIPSISWNFKF